MFSSDPGVNIYLLFSRIFLGLITVWFSEGALSESVINLTKHKETRHQRHIIAQKSLAVCHKTEYALLNKHLITQWAAYGLALRYLCKSWFEGTLLNTMPCILQFENIPYNFAIFVISRVVYAFSNFALDAVLKINVTITEIMSMLHEYDHFVEQANRILMNTTVID